MHFVLEFFGMLDSFEISRVDLGALLFYEAHIPGDLLTNLQVIIRNDHSLRYPEMSQSALEVDGYASVMDFHDNAFHSDYFVTVFHISELPLSKISRI